MKYTKILKSSAQIIFKKLKTFVFLVRIYKYLEIKIFLNKKLKNQFYLSKGSSTFKPYKNKKVFIPLIETSHPLTHQILILGKALQLRGASVKVLLCGEVLDGCEVKSINNEKINDRCWDCRVQRNNLIPFYGLETFSIDDILSKKVLEKFKKESLDIKKNKKIILHDIDLTKSIKESIIRYFYGKVPKDDKKNNKLLSEHIFTGLLTTEIAYKIDQKWNPDIVLNHMTAYSAWNGIYEYYKKNGNRFHTITYTQFDFKKISFDWNDLYHSNKRFIRYCNYRKNKNLYDKEKDILNTFLNNRYSGNSAIFKKYGCFEDDSLKNLKLKIKFDGKKRNIFLFSNLLWDIGLDDFDGLYKKVILWVKRTIILLANNKNINLYIKPHPAEKYESDKTLKGLKEILLDELEEIPKNIFFIDHELKVNSYDLFPLIDLGLVYSGTLGLEMILNQIPTVSAGKTPFYKLGFSGEPKNENTYLKYLLGEKKVIIPDQEKVKLFAYFYFIRSKIPWNLTHKAYGGRFKGFTFKKLDEILPGKSNILDHLCDCIVSQDKKIVPEAWPEET